MAERLRASYYLPLAGAFRLAVASQPQFATRVLRQSAMDWLLDAIERSVSPRDINELRTDAAGEKGPSTVTLRVDPLGAAQAIRQSWLQGQIAYHANNAQTMSRMSAATARWTAHVERYGGCYRAVGFIDHGKLPAELAAELVGAIARFAPYLVLASAVLPAAAAGISGIRFQSECRRLADRSLVMRRLLEQSDQRAEILAENIHAQQQDPAIDLGSWTPAVLRLAETIARELVEELSEWSVIYSKEVSQP